MQGYGQLDDSKVRTQVSPSPGYFLNEERPDVLGQLYELLSGELFEIGGRVDRVEKCHIYTL